MNDEEQESVLLEERHGPVAVLTLNRPHRLNAVSLAIYQQLTRALGALQADRSVRVVVLTGAGRAFCVGADLKAHDQEELSAEERRVYVGEAQRMHARLQRLSKPVVAAVNGHAIGAGMELTLSSDFVIVAEHAKLRFPEIALGTFVGGGTVYTLPRRVGLLRAKELILLGDFFTPADAVAWGLANRVVPADRVLAEALEVAAALARRAPVSMQHAKHLLDEAQGMPARRALDREAKALLECMATQDWREGVRAFHEKREPEFRGE